MRGVFLGILAAAAALSAAVYAAYRSDIIEARNRVASGSEIAATRCGPIEYKSLGEGPAVLFVHGAGGGFDQGLDFVRPLLTAGFRVILVSRFGYLGTPLPADASAAAQADAHACLLDALKVERAAVFGASAGAPSSLQFALRHPQRCRALILLVPAAYPSLNTPPATPFLFETALKSDFLFWAATRFARKTVMRNILATPPEVVEQASADEQARVERMMELILPVSPRRLGLINDAAVISSLPRYELERISAPTLTISAADDRFGTYEPARYTAQHIRGARFIGYPTGGHMWVGRHQQVMAEIAAFLKRE